MSLPRLSHYGHCAKCGQWTGDAPMSYGVGGMMSYGDGRIALHDEHLERTCPRCGYKWQEACLDA